MALGIIVQIFKDGRKNDERKGGGHNDIPVLKHLAVDSEDETEGNGATDHAGEPDEDLLFECQAAIVPAKLQEKEQSNYGDESANHNYEDLDDDKCWTPLEVSKTEE